jgi:hypothetical protein
VHLFPREFLVGDHYQYRGQWMEIAGLKDEGVTSLVSHTDPTIHPLHLDNQTQYLVRSRGSYQPRI